MFGSMIAWGISWSSIKIMSEYLRTEELVFVRYAITAIALFFIVIAMRLNFKIDRRSLLLAFLVGLLTVIYGYVIFLGTELGTASLAGAFINTLSPINTFLIMAIFYKRKIARLDLGALTLGFIGTMLMLGVWQFDAQKIFTAYNLYFVLGAWLWSLVTITSSHSRSNMIVFSFYLYLFTTILALFAIDISALDLTKTDSRFWLNTLFVSVISTAIASTIFFLGTKKLGADGVSSFMFVTPVSAIGFGVIALGETLSFWTLIGIFAAILAVYMLNRIGIFKPKLN